MAREVVEVITPSDLDGLPDGTTYKRMSTTEQTKLTGIEESADANVGEEFTTANQTKLTGIDAGAEVNPTDLADLDSTAATKLSGIEDSATADQTGTEMQTAIVGLSDAARVLVGSEPQTGEKKIYGIHRNAAGNLEMDSEDTAV